MDVLDAVRADAELAIAFRDLAVDGVMMQKRDMIRIFVTIDARRRLADDIGILRGFDLLERNIGMAEKLRHDM